MICDLLEKDPDFSACLKLLPNVEEVALNKLRGTNPSESREGIMNALKAGYTTYEQQMSLNFMYVREASKWKNDLVVNVCIYSHETFTTEKDRVCCAIASCIDPLVGFIEYEFAKQQNLFRIFQRYQVLCEWYDRDSLVNQRETVLTQQHLSRFLFSEGYTFVFSELNVPSGRADIYIHEERVVAEAKLFDGAVSIKQVFNQAEKRVHELSLPIGYCVVFCKEKKIPIFEDADVSDGEFTYFNIQNGRCIVFIVIRLFDAKSTEPLENISIRIRP